MSDDGSVFDRVRRTIAGLTPAERAEKLKDRARAEPDALDGEDVEAAANALERLDREAGE